MKFNIYSKFLPAMTIAAMLLTACEDKNSYAPGEPDDPDCMGVYFDESNMTDFLFMPGVEAEITLKMHRLNTVSEADVPLVFTASADGIIFPEKAHFEAGSADTEVTIDCREMPLRKNVTIDVSIPKEYVSTYSAYPYGYRATALASKWESANTDGSPVKFYFTSEDYCYYDDPGIIVSSIYEPLECEMEVLPGSGMIRIFNFMNADVDVMFSLTPSPYDDYAGKYRVYPLDHVFTYADAYDDPVGYGDAYYNAWFLEYDEDNYATSQLTLIGGKSSVLNYPGFYAYSDSDAFEYSYMTPKSDTRSVNRASMGIRAFPENGIILPDYFYLYFSWDGESGL